MTETQADVASCLAAIAVFLSTLFFLPALSYVSIVMYGFPVNLVVLGGYVGWLLLHRVSSMLADLCGIAFVMAVALVLGAVLLIKASLALMILFPSGLLYMVLRILGYRPLQRSQQTIENAGPMH